MSSQTAVSIVLFLGLLSAALFVQTLICYTLWGLLQVFVFPTWMEPTMFKAFILQFCIILPVNLVRRNSK